jgi:hypothetical protein
MPAWYAKITGRHPAGRVDHDVAAKVASYQTGQLQVYLLQPSVTSFVTPISNVWVCKIQGPSTAPRLLKKIEIANTSWTDVHSFSLAIMTTGIGSPSTSNAFIGWNTLIAPVEVWTWDGEVPLIDRYIYVKGDAAGMTMYWQVEELDR